VVLPPTNYYVTSLCLVLFSYHTYSLPVPDDGLLTY